MRKCIGLIGIVCLLEATLAVPAVSGAEIEAEVQGILERFTEDFRQDPFAAELELVIGIEIDDVGEWYLTVAGNESVVLESGAVPVPAPYYVTDLETLRRIDRGELGIMTSMGRARMSDPTPMNYGFANGYQLTPDAMATLLPFTFHFWTKGQPEVVPFGELEQARVIHGAYSTLFYYHTGLRSSYFRLESGQHVNANESEQTNPFPSLFVFIGGTTECRIGGQEMTVDTRLAMLVPAGTTHEFWNPHDEPAEFILIMFGEGA